VAYVVCRAMGLECSTQSSDYIQLYSGDEKVLMQSLELIRSVAARIIEQLSELDASDRSSPAMADLVDSSHLGDEEHHSVPSTASF
jgi:hypothetical protein